MTEPMRQSSWKSAVNMRVFSGGRWRPCLLVFCVLAIAALVTASCGGPTSPSGSSNLRLMLTDAPSDEVGGVYVHFTSVTVKPIGQAPQEFPLPLTLSPNPVDLLTLADVSTLFAAGEVPVSDYEFIRINIDQDLSYALKLGGNPANATDRLPLRVPSEEIKILGGFAVDADTTTTLTLDFDVDASLVKLGTGDWLLRPVIVITGHNTSS